MTLEYLAILLRSLAICLLPFSSCHFLEYFTKAFFFDLYLKVGHINEERPHHRLSLDWRHNQLFLPSFKQFENIGNKYNSHPLAERRGKWLDINTETIKFLSEYVK